MNCELLNGLLGGFAASAVTLVLYFVDRRNKRRDQVKPEKLHLVKALSVHIETLRRLMFVVNMYLENMEDLEVSILTVTKKKFIEELQAIEKLKVGHPYLLDKKYWVSISELQAAIVNMHNFPSDSPLIGRTLGDGRRLHEDVVYQLDLVERQLRFIIGTD